MSHGAKIVRNVGTAKKNSKNFTFFMRLRTQRVRTQRVCPAVSFVPKLTKTAKT